MPEDKGWNASTVLKMLRNPRYAGFSTYTTKPKVRKYHFTKDGQMILNTAEPEERRRAWYGERVRDERTGEWVRGQWEPIVDEETWERVQAVLDDPGRRPKVAGKGGKTARTHLGSGLWRCPVCGGRVHLQGVCYTCTGHVTRKADAVDAYVQDVVLAVLKRPDFTDLVCVRRDADRQRAQELRREITALRDRVERAERDYADDAIRAGDLARVRNRCEAKIAEATSELAGLGAGGKAPVEFATDPAAAFREADLDRKRRVIDLLCDVYLTRTDRSENARKNRRGEKLDVAKAVEFRWKTGAAPAEG